MRFSEARKIFPQTCVLSVQIAPQGADSRFLGSGFVVGGADFVSADRDSEAGTLLAERKLLSDARSL